MTTSPHLPLCADSAALWELLPHPSLSSFKLGVRYWKEDLSEFGGKSLNSLSPSDLRWSLDHSWHHSASPPLDLRYFSQLLWTQQSNEWDGAGNDCSSAPQMGDLSGAALTVMEVSVNQRAMKAGTTLLQSCSDVWSVTGRTRCDPKRIDTHANSDTDDSLGFAS